MSELTGVANLRFTLRQLQVFVTIATHENVSRAAEALAMSQSACSGALKELEHAYNMQLFDRIGKRLSINATGRELYAHAQGLLDRAVELDQTLLRHQEAAHLKVGATLTIGNYLAVEMIQAFMQSTGGKASLSVENTQKIVEGICHFDLDVALVEGEVNHPDLEVIPWREDKLVCCCHPEHPLAAKAILHDSDLLAAQWILRESGSGTRQAFDRAMYGILPKLNLLMELQHTEAIKHAVKANLGIACLSEIALEESFSYGSLVPLGVEGRDLSRRFYVLLHKKKYKSHGITQWLELCESA